MQIVSPNTVNIGNIRVTYFDNQIGFKHQFQFADRGDFLVDQKYTFEIGGKGKSKHQIEGMDNAFIAADDIEIGFNEKIPLWLFGFLY